MTYFVLAGAILSCAMTKAFAGEPLEDAAKVGIELNLILQNATQLSTPCLPEVLVPNPASSTHFELAQEIINLAGGSVIPAEIYSKYDARTIGVSIVERLHRLSKCQFDKEIKEDSEGSRIVDFGRDYIVHIAFDEQYLESIRDRCFLNQHQVNHSNGSMWPSRRKEREDEMAGLLLEKEYNSNPKVHQVRPKYAYYSPTRTVFGRQYGNVHAVLKNSLKKRTTFVLGDSLVHIGPLETCPADFNGPVPYRHSAEAQVWGSLCLTDVEYFVVGCFSPVGEHTLKIMRETGVPVYQCGIVSNLPALQAVEVQFPGKLLFGKSETSDSKTIGSQK